MFDGNGGGWVGTDPQRGRGVGVLLGVCCSKGCWFWGGQEGCDGTDGGCLAV